MTRSICLLSLLLALPLASCTTHPTRWLPVNDVPKMPGRTLMTEAERDQARATLLAAAEGQKRAIAAAATVDAERDAAERKISEQRHREAEARLEGE